MRLPAALAAAALLLAACGGDDDPGSDARTATSTPTPVPTSATSTSRASVPAQPLRVELRQEALVDTRRPTPDGQGGVLTPDRTLVTDVYVPEGAGPYPLIVHAHGKSGSPARHSLLLRAWAEAGYVVAAPAFPLTNDEAELQVLADYVEQPADMSFVIDELLRLSRPGGPLAGKIDGDHVGVSGLSLGGGTVWGLTFNTCCRDDRVDAVIVMSGLQFPFDGDFLDAGPPLLLIHGTADAALPYEKGVEPYAAITTPKFLLTLVEGTHSAPYENHESPHDEVVERVTLDWWASWLRADTAARERLADDAAVEGLTTVDASL